MAVRTQTATVEIGDYTFTFSIERDYAGGAEWDVRVNEPTRVEHYDGATDTTAVVAWANLPDGFRAEVMEACHDKAYQELYEHADRIRDEEEGWS